MRVLTSIKWWSHPGIVGPIVAAFTAGMFAVILKCPSDDKLSVGGDPPRQDQEQTQTVNVGLSADETRAMLREHQRPVLEAIDKILARLPPKKTVPATEDVIFIRAVELYNEAIDLLQQAESVADARSVAIRKLHASIELHPDADAHCALGRALHGQGNLDAAIAEYREALRLDPRSVVAHNNLGVALVDKGNLHGAIEKFRDAIRFDSGELGARSNLQSALELIKGPDDVTTSTVTVVRNDTKSAAHHNHLGLTLGRQGRFEEAAAEFRKAIRFDPELVVPHHNLAMALGELGDIDAAIAEYREAIRLDPNAAEPHNGLGTVLAKQESLDAAIAEYREAIRLDSTHVDAHVNLGVSLLLQDNITEAIPSLRNAIRLDPACGLCYFNLGCAFTRAGRLDEALEALSTAIALDSNYRLEAKTDQDFDEIRNDPSFKRLVYGE